MMTNKKTKKSYLMKRKMMYKEKKSNCVKKPLDKKVNAKRNLMKIKLKQIQMMI